MKLSQVMLKLDFVSVDLYTASLDSCMSCCSRRIILEVASFVAMEPHKIRLEKSSGAMVGRIVCWRSLVSTSSHCHTPPEIRYSSVCLSWPFVRTRCLI